MDKIENKVYSKYKKEITRIIQSKYKKRAYSEAQVKKIYFTHNHDNRKEIKKVADEIYKTYLPIIETEIKVLVSDFVNSKKFQQTVENEKNLQKKKLSYKSLKHYQKFKINIDNKFLKLLLEEINNDGGTPIGKEELKYILLSILYKIIDYIKNGYIVKVSTIFTIWLEKRDIRVNLPDAKKRIMEDRIMPKIKLCKNFGYTLFNTINEDNEAIINYYKAKMERFLTLLKIKQTKGD